MTDEEKKARKREYNKRYYAEHREKRREYYKRYYAEHREEILAREKAKYWADPEGAREKGKAKWKKWILNHPEFRKLKVQYNRHWRANNPDKARRHNQNEMIEYRKEWFRQNPDKVQEYRRRRREKLRAERERTRSEKMDARRALFESRLKNIPKTDVLDRIRDLLEWRRLRKSLR